MVASNRNLLFQGSIFRGELLVSGRVRWWFHPPVFIVFLQGTWTSQTLDPRWCRYILKVRPDQSPWKVSVLMFLFMFFFSEMVCCWLFGWQIWSWDWSSRLTKEKLRITVEREKAEVQVGKTLGKRATKKKQRRRNRTVTGVVCFQTLVRFEIIGEKTSFNNISMKHAVFLYTVYIIAFVFQKWLVFSTFSCLISTFFPGPNNAYLNRTKQNQHVITWKSNFRMFLARGLQCTHQTGKIASLISGNSKSMSIFGSNLFEGTKSRFIDPKLALWLPSTLSTSNTP